MRLLLVDDDAGARKRLRRDLEGRGHRAETARDGVEAWHRLQEGGFDGVVTEFALQHMNGLELARAIRRTASTRDLIVLLVSDGDPTLLLTARDLVDDVLPKDVSVDALVERLTTLRERAAEAARTGQPPPVDGGRVIVVTSAKGGSGVSSVAANLALALALTTELTTVACDLDLQYGDLPMLLDLQPTSTLADLVREIALDGDHAAPEAHLLHDPSGLRLLASPPSPVEGLRVDETAVRSAISRLRSMFDVLVVDVPPGFGDPAIAALLMATRIVLVVSPDVPTLRRTRAFLDVLSDLEIPVSRVLTVLNPVTGALRVSRERAEQLLDRRFAVQLPHAPELFDRAVTAGNPVVRIEPVGEAARAFLRLGERVLLPG